MHVAGQLFTESFGARIAGEEVGVDAVFPDWIERDVFGIVVDTALGGLGASLLMQLAIAKFYEVKPARRREAPSYPDLFVFHVGGHRGDFSYFDCWPPRREVFLPTGSSPLTLLEEVNSRGVTRLALPAGPLGDPAVLTQGPSVWAEQGAAIDRLRSCFLYAPGGEVEGGDTELFSTDPRVFENIAGTLDPRPTIRADRERAAHVAATTPGAPLDIDALRWDDIAERRYVELSDEARRRVGDRMSDRFGSAGRGLHESYARITPEQALSRIAAIAPASITRGEIRKPYEYRGNPTP